MAITQERMLALVFAAVDYKDAYERLRKFAIQQRNHAKDGTITYEDGLELVALSARVSEMLQRPVESGTTIVLESKHFSSSKIRENQKRAKREAERRRLQGIPKREMQHRDVAGYEVTRLVDENRLAPRSASNAMFETKDKMEEALAQFSALAEQFDTEQTVNIPGAIDGDDPDPTGNDLDHITTIEQE